MNCAAARATTVVQCPVFAPKTATQHLNLPTLQCPKPTTRKKPRTPKKKQEQSEKSKKASYPTSSNPPLHPHLFLKIRNLPQTVNPKTLNNQKTIASNPPLPNTNRCHQSTVAANETTTFSKASPNESKPLFPLRERKVRAVFFKTFLGLSDSISKPEKVIAFIFIVVCITKQPKTI